MKTANRFTLLLLGVALSFSVTACKKTPKSPTPIFGQARTAPRGGNTPSGIEGAAPTLPPNSETMANPLGSGSNRLGGNPDDISPLGARPTSLDDYVQDRDMFRQETVFFGFDKYNLPGSELSRVQNVANYLMSETASDVLVEGHCDERGTPEYNRALGERRALSVREALITLGISGDRVHTTSYGEDMPLDPSHNQEAYAKNRRGEFVLLKPKTGGSAF